MSAERPSSARTNRPETYPLLHDHPVAWRLGLGLWGLSTLLFVALAIPAFAGAVQSLDNVVHRWVVSAQSEPIVTAAKVLDFVGSVWVTWPLMAALAGWLAWRRKWGAFSAWVLAMAVSQLLIGPIKDLYMRPRPPMSLVETTSWSFPSGHSVAGATIAVAAVILLVAPGPKRRNLELLAAAFAVVMALSRVYLRAHWLSDVAASAALGVAIAIGSAALMHRIDDRRRERWYGSRRF